MKRKHANNEDNLNEIPMKKNTLDMYLAHMKKINEQKKQKRYLKPKSKEDLQKIKDRKDNFKQYLNNLNEQDRTWEQYQSDNVFNIDFLDDEYFTVDEITAIDLSEYLIDGYIKYINWSRLNTIDEFLELYKDKNKNCTKKSNYIEFVGTYNGFIIESDPNKINYKNVNDISTQTELQIIVNENTTIKGYFIDSENTQHIDFNEYDILQLGYVITINENCTLEIPCNVELLDTVYINGTLKCNQSFLHSEENSSNSSE